MQGRLGIIPQEAADEIVRHCDIDKIDMEKLRAQTERIGYPDPRRRLAAQRAVPRQLGEYCHWGATTQDITDTATVLQIREALALVDADLAAISKALADLGAALPRHADGRPQQPAAGDPGHLRLQDGRTAVGDRAPSRAAGATAAARAGRRVRRRRRHARVDREGRHGDAGRPDGRARPRHSPRSPGTRSATTSPRSAPSSVWSAARWASSRWTSS